MTPLLQPITLDEFLAAERQLAASRGEETDRWRQLAKGLRACPKLVSGFGVEPEVFLASAIVGPERPGLLEEVVWCLAEELVDPSALAQPRMKEALGDRLRPLQAAIVRSCPTCATRALVVGRNDYWVDAARDPNCTTELHALCLAAPHAVMFASSSTWQSFDALK